MATFSPARPIGVRARSGSPSAPAGNHFEVHAEARPEFEAIQQNRLDPQLTPAVSIALWARLKQLVQAARDGVVRFQGENPDGKAMTLHDCVYTLRPSASKGRLQLREVRLYCGEPVREAKLVLGLHLATKPRASEDVDDEQNAAIEEAVRRATAWELSRIHESLFE